MKKILLLILLIAVSFNNYAQAPVVFFNFLSHDEDTGPWNSNSYYLGDRSKLISLANYFQSHGITYNMQSDWLYLTNVIAKDTGVILNLTNNKNILRWMIEDKGVEMDPHAHENSYIYPDIVKLMDSLGLPESKIIGGSLYKEENGNNVWTNLIDGQYGSVFPNKFWEPDYLMGGGTPAHVADLNYYGFWNPKDTANYLTHDTTTHLRHIGIGCDIKIKDEFTIEEIVAQLKDVVNKVQSGQYPSNGFYIQTIFFGHGDLNDIAFYNKIIQIADSANAIVQTGQAEWKTLKQAYTIWETDYNEQMFQLECGDVTSGISEISKQNEISIYPNPFTTETTFETNQNLKDATLTIYNVFGQQVKEMNNIYGQKVNLQRDNLNEGMYFIRITQENKMVVECKLIIMD